MGLALEELTNSTFYTADDIIDTKRMVFLTHRFYIQGP